MKLVIISLFLFVSFAHAQEESRAKVMLIVAEDITEYAQECWNDSTEQAFEAFSGAIEHENFWFVPVIENNGTWVWKAIPKVYYTHREPTLQGFFKFLIKKYQK